MCGRYGFIPKNDVYETEPKYNAAPGAVMPVVLNINPMKVSHMKWGLVPEWAKDPKIAYSTINARAEEIENRPVYRNAFRSRRCLIPASGFYEWKKVSDEGKPVKIPYWISIKKAEIFGFAGIFENDTFSIVTTTANELMKFIHDRMPVIIRRQDENKWLDNDRYNLAELKTLMVPYPPAEMTAYRVSARVNNPSNNDEELIKPI